VILLDDVFGELEAKKAVGNFGHLNELGKTFCNHDGFFKRIPVG
jgi:hypothetical protein